MREKIIDYLKEKPIASTWMVRLHLKHHNNIHIRHELKKMENEGIVQKHHSTTRNNIVWTLVDK